MNKKGLIGIARMSLVIVSLIFLGFLIYQTISFAEVSATIWTTDFYGIPKTNFVPEETVYIHGSNFLKYHNVDISITRPDGVVNTGSALVDRDRNFIYEYILDGINGTYYVFATDGVNTASTIFTDANPAGNLDQCKNGGLNETPLSPCEWVNGDLNPEQAHFIEGQSVPYRIRLTDIPIAGTANCSSSGIDCELLIGYDIKNSGKNALDYVTHFQRIAETVNPCAGISTCVAGNLFDVPMPASILVNGTPQPNTSFNNLPASERKIQIYNGQITGVSYASQGNLLDAQSETVIKIKFNANNPTVVIAWGGHIASLLDWGVGNSASGISGSPYHTRFKELCTPDIDKKTGLVILNCAGGNQDRSLKSAAVLPPPTCDFYTNQTACDLDPNCDWCPLCEYPFPSVVTSTKTNQWLQAKCVPAGTDCGWHCEIDSCGATCDSDSQCSCPTDGCIGDDYYNYPLYGSCVDCSNSCYCDIGTNTSQPCEPNITHCTGDDCYDYETGCEDRDYFCTVGGCNYNYSNRHTDYYDDYIYYCSDSTIRKHRLFHDFACNGVCSDHTDWANDQLVEDCNVNDGWYNTTTTQWLNDTQCTEKEQLQQKYRDYTCSPPANCTYSVNNTRWIDTGTTKNKPDSTPCDDGFWCSETDHCENGSCVQLTARNCSGFNLCGIASCDWNPDLISATFDWRAAFISQCVEDGNNQGHCTTGNETIEHFCADSDSLDNGPIIPIGNGVRTCNAECDGFGTECQNYCDGETRYFNGNCSLGSCSCSYQNEECTGDGCYPYETGCEDIDFYCAPESCEYNSSNQHTDYNDSFVNYCSSDTIRKHRQFHDFACNGVCSDHTSWVDDQLVENCSLRNGWEDTGRTRWLSTGECTEKEQKEQEYRDYTCYENLVVECNYTITGTQWVDTDNTRNKPDGTTCNDELYCTNPDTCTAGVCGGPTIDCSDFTNQCNLGFCNEDNDRCEYAPKETSHPCDNGFYCDGPDHCNATDAGGLVPAVCENLGPSIDCSSLNGKCQEGICNETQDKCVANYDDYPLSTPCEADQDLCTIDHCDGYGLCVNNYTISAPSSPIKTIGEPEEKWYPTLDPMDPDRTNFYPWIVDKCWNGQLDQIECWKVTMFTPITLSCEDSVDNESVCFKVELDASDATHKYCEDMQGQYNATSGYCCVDNEIEIFYFNEETEHNLEAYCANVCGISEKDEEKFKVEGTAFEIPLYQKWNLISVPFVLLNNDPDVVFNNTNIISVWTFDNGIWYVWNPGDGPDSIDSINPGWGYWVLTSNNTKLVIGGSLFSPATTPPSKDLTNGWNLIGYYGTEWQEYLDGLDDCGYYYEYGNYAYCALNSLIDTQKGFPRWSSLWSFVNCGDHDPYWTMLNSCDNIYAGKGYWIEMDIEELYAPASNCLWNKEFQCSSTTL